MSRILYLSFDGVKEPLGHSQIVRPLLALAARGHRFTLLTLEKDATQDAALRARFAHAGIRWREAPFATGSRFLRNTVRLLALASEENDVALIHARGFQSGVVALAAQKRLGAKLLYDSRAFWSQQRREQGTLPGWRYGVALGFERAIYRRADALVMLTELACRELRHGRMGRVRAPVQCIPTIADSDAFVLRRRQGEVPAAVKDSGLVLGFVGSLNADYLADESLSLWQRVATRRKDAVLVVLGPHERALRERLRALRIDPARIVFAQASHEEMPRWLSWIDWGFLLLREAPGKQASMPTKFAEFLLSGVRPIHYGCNAELREWVVRTGTGFSLQGLHPKALDAATDRLLGERFFALERGRAEAMQHFSLAAGAAAYAALYERLLRPCGGNPSAALA